MARKTISPLDKLSQRLQYWVTLVERARIVHEAEKQGLTVSEHTRRMMLRPAHALTVHLPRPAVKTAIELRRLGARLEQIAGRLDDIDELPELIQIVDGLAKQLVESREAGS